MIKFYKRNDPYGCFGNFSRHSIELNGKTWPTTEHYFQAQKFAGTPYEEQVRACATPKEARETGIRRDLPLRKDWELVKDNVMRDAVLKKVMTYPEIRLLLGNWCKWNWKKYMLGKILMEIRSKI